MEEKGTGNLIALTGMVSASFCGKLKCCKIDERLPFFLEGSVLRHDQASNKTFSLMYSILRPVWDNFKVHRQAITSFGIARRFLSLQLNMAPLVSPIVEQKTTPGDPAREENETSKSNTYQNTTRTTHNDSVRQQFFLATNDTDS